MSVNLIVDLVLALIIAVGAIVGIKMGFIKTVAKPVKIIASFFLALAFASIVGNEIIAPIITQPISNKLESVLLEVCTEIAPDNITAGIPTLIKFAAGVCGINLDSVITGDTTAEIIHSVSLALTEPVVEVAAFIVAFIILHILLKLLLTLLFAMINKAVDKGVVGKVNRILGCVFTLMFSLVVCWALCAVFDFVVHVPAVYESEWAQQFTGGVIYNLFKNVSPLELLLSF